MGMGLSFKQGPPKLDWYLKDPKQCHNLQVEIKGKEFYDFQEQATKLLRESLPKEKTLLGFVGTPFSLFCYAVEGTSTGRILESKTGLYDGRFTNFCKVLFPELLESMIAQARGGAEMICLFDSAAGELGIVDYQEFLLPILQELIESFKQHYPEVGILYYAKKAPISFFRLFKENKSLCHNVDILGMDWRIDINSALKEFASDFRIQGGIDPFWAVLPKEQFERNLRSYWKEITSDSDLLGRYIFSFGHGVS